jgi:hypothetical protein
VSDSFDSECRRAGELLSLSLDGELSVFQRWTLERHQRACEPCRRRGEQMRAITLALRGSALERPSRPLLPVFLGRRRTARSGLAVATAFVVAFGFGVLQRSAPRERPVQAPPATSGSAVPVHLTSAPQPVVQPASSSVVYVGFTN